MSIFALERNYMAQDLNTVLTVLARFFLYFQVSIYASLNFCLPFFETLAATNLELDSESQDKTSVKVTWDNSSNLPFKDTKKEYSWSLNPICLLCITAVS